MNNHPENQFMIDEITWNDLNLDEIYSGMNKAHSSVGSEYLKKTLQTPLFQTEPLKQRSKKIAFFQNNKQASAKVSACFKSLGKTKKVSFLDYIFRLKEVPAKSNGVHILLVILLLAAVALIFIRPAIGIIAFVVMIAVNIIVYFKLRAGVEGYFICLKYLVSMVVCAEKILSSGALDKTVFAEDTEKLNSSVKVFSKMKAGSWLITNSVSGSLVDVIMDYIRMIFHVDLMKFNSMRQTALDNEDHIMELYDTLGELETCICVASYRDQLSYYCEPSFYDPAAYKKDGGHTLVASDIYHPLIASPVANTIKTERSVLLTGSNASGKSTFLKTVAINQLFAQTIYTCPARQFISTFYKIFSSMALTDNILGNESYFIVEIKSLKRVFDAVSEIPVMCFVDEVLRGTNTIERIAASSKLLEKLTAENTLVFAATHDIELTTLLTDCMDNYHFSETVDGEKVSFDYLLKEGAANSSNAIKLLGAFGFDSSVVDGAKERAVSFAESGVWN